MPEAPREIIIGIAESGRTFRLDRWAQPQCNELKL